MCETTEMFWQKAKQEEKTARAGAALDVGIVLKKQTACRRYEGERGQGKREKRRERQGGMRETGKKDREKTAKGRERGLKRGKSPEESILSFKIILY